MTIQVEERKPLASKIGIDITKQGLIRINGRKFNFNGDTENTIKSLIATTQNLQFRSLSIKLDEIHRVNPLLLAEIVQGNAVQMNFGLDRESLLTQ